jgi:hypothetical protein
LNQIEASQEQEGFQVLAIGCEYLVARGDGIGVFALCR